MKMVGKSHCTLVSLGCFTMRYLVVLHRAVWVTHFAAAVFSSRFFFQDVGVMNSWETQFAIFLVTKVCTFFLWPMCIHVKFRCTLRVLLALDLSKFWYVPMLRFTSLCATVKTSQELICWEFIWNAKTISWDKSPHFLCIPCWVHKLGWLGYNL